MKEFRKVLYVIYLLFHAGILGAILYMFNLFGSLLHDYRYIIYIAAFGLALYILDLIIDQMISREYNKKISSLEQEVNALKAKMYDMSGSKSKPEILPSETRSGTAKQK